MTWGWLLVLLGAVTWGSLLEPLTATILGGVIADLDVEPDDVALVAGHPEGAGAVVEADAVVRDGRSTWLVAAFTCTRL